MKVRAMVRVREDKGKGLKSNDEGDSNGDDNIVARGQQRCRRCRCVVGRPRMRVRAMARVREDEGDGEDDNNIVAQGQQRCCCCCCCVVGCPRTRVRAMARV